MIKKFLGLILTVSILLGACKKETRTLQEIEELSIKEFLAKNNLTSQFKKHITDTATGVGFYYQIINEGNPDLKTLDYPDIVTFSHKTTSINKTVNYEVSEYYPTVDFLGYIKPIAWREAIRKVKKGAVIRVLLPSYLAYGKNGSGVTIPGNSILDTRIEVADDTDREAYEEKLIKKFAEANGINAVKDESGIYYQIINQGTGAKPESNSTVKVAYTGRLLTGTIFDSRTAEAASNSSLSGFIEGWQLILPKLQAGGKIRLLIPSRYAYGESGVQSSPIKPNTILDFDVELISVN